MFIINIKLQAQAFTNLFISSIQYVSRGDVKWGDYDNDGDLDALVCGLNNSSTTVCKIYRNDGSNVFTDISASLIGLKDCDIEWFDYNNDGRLDIITAGTNQSNVDVVNIYRNDSNNVLTTLSHTILGLLTPSVDFGDYDNDGKVDLLMTGYSTSLSVVKTIIYKNYGSGVFTNINASIIGVRNGDAKWCDYDNDGDLDFIVTGYNSPTSPQITQLYKNDNGTFVPIITNIIGTQASVVEWGDFDNDGDFDMVISGVNSKVYRNDGNDIFTDLNINFVANLVDCKIDLGDYNNDGLLDIFLSGHYSISGGWAYVSNIYKNNGNGTFTDINAFIGANGDISCSVDWGDYDNDGDLDLLICGIDASLQGSTLIIRNNSSVLNTKPTRPTYRTTVVNGNSATLYWNQCSDNQTPKEALTYNVFIGKGNYDESIMSSMSTNKPTAIGVVPFGRRDVARLGNVLYDTTYTINNLDTGTYYWGVQTIDNGYLGSDFASTQNFTILPTPVGINEKELIDEINIYPNPTNNTLNIEFNETQEYIIGITNVSGKLIKNMVSFSTITKIDVSKFENGLYFINITSENTNKSLKFIKN